MMRKAIRRRCNGDRTTREYCSDQAKQRRAAARPYGSIKIESARARAIDAIEHMFRRHRLRRDGGPKRRQRVVDRSPDRGASRDGPSFPDASRTECCNRCRRLDMRDVNVRHLAGHGNEIINKTSVLELAFAAVDALLVQRRTDALHDATADLLVHQQWIDHAAAILDHPEIEHADGAKLGIDFDVSGLDAICRDVWNVARCIAL